MIYRGPGILVEIFFVSSPSASPPVSKLDRRHTGRLEMRDNLQTGGGKEGVGEEPNHSTTRKPWSSLNYSIISAVLYIRVQWFLLGFFAFRVHFGPLKLRYSQLLFYTFFTQNWKILMFYFIGIGKNVDIYPSKRLWKLSVTKIGLSFSKPILSP